MQFYAKCLNFAKLESELQDKRSKPHRVKQMVLRSSVDAPFRLLTKDGKEPISFCTYSIIESYFFDRNSINYASKALFL